MTLHRSSTFHSFQGAYNAEIDKTTKLTANSSAASHEMVSNQY